MLHLGILGLDLPKVHVFRKAMKRNISKLTHLCCSKLRCGSLEFDYYKTRVDRLDLYSKVNLPQEGSCSKRVAKTWLFSLKVTLWVSTSPWSKLETRTKFDKAGNFILNSGKDGPDGPAEESFSTLVGTFGLAHKKQRSTDRYLLPFDRGAPASGGHSHCRDLPARYVSFPICLISHLKRDFQTMEHFWRQILMASLWVCECNEVQEHAHGCICCKDAKQVYLLSDYFSSAPIPWICIFCAATNANTTNECRTHDCPGRPNVYGICECIQIRQIELVPGDEMCAECKQVCSKMYQVSRGLLRKEMEKPGVPSLPSRGSLPCFTFNKGTCVLSPGYDDLNNVHLAPVFHFWMWNPRQLVSGPIRWNCNCSNASLERGQFCCPTCKNRSLVFAAWFSNVPVKWMCKGCREECHADAISCPNCQENYGIIQPRIKWQSCQCPELVETLHSKEEKVCSNCFSAISYLYEISTVIKVNQQETQPLSRLDDKNSNYCVMCQVVSSAPHLTEGCSNVPVWHLWKRIKIVKEVKPKGKTNGRKQFSKCTQNTQANQVTEENALQEALLAITLLESQSETRCLESKYPRHLRHHEVVVTPDLPWLCQTCGFLNPRDKPPLHRQGMVRHVCAINANHERAGFWECQGCTLLHPLEPRRTKEDCELCGHRTIPEREVKIHYMDGLDMDYQDEKSVVAQMKKEFYAREQLNILGQFTLSTGMDHKMDHKIIQPDEEEQIYRVLQELKETKTLVDPTLLALPQQHMRDILKKNWETSPTAGLRLALWFSLHVRISLTTHHRLLALWPQLIDWLSMNPVIEEIWRLSSGKLVLPPECWLILLQYCSSWGMKADKLHAAWIEVLATLKWRGNGDQAQIRLGPRNPQLVMALYLPSMCVRSFCDQINLIHKRFSCHWQSFVSLDQFHSARQTFLDADLEQDACGTVGHASAWHIFARISSIRTKGMGDGASTCFSKEPLVCGLWLWPLAAIIQLVTQAARRTQAIPKAKVSPLRTPLLSTSFLSESSDQEL